MTDLLLSLSAWMLVSLTIIPIGIEFTRGGINEKKVYEATIILYEVLQESLVEGQILPTKSIRRNDKQYQLHFNPETKEVCVEFEINQISKEKVCEFWE